MKFWDRLRNHELDAETAAREEKVEDLTRRLQKHRDKNGFGRLFDVAFHPPTPRRPSHPYPHPHGKV